MGTVTHSVSSTTDTSLGCSVSAVVRPARSERRFRHVLSRIPAPADEPDVSVEILDRLAKEAAGARTQQAFTMLNDRDREILTLCVLEELPLAQVSELLRVPLGTVKSRLSRAKSRLAELVTTSNTGYTAERGLS